MANHKSAEKRARQAIKRQQRNRATRSKVHTADRALRSEINQLKAASSPENQKKVSEKLRSAFSSIQKARGVLHRNTVKRKMARLAKAASNALKSASGS